MRAQRGFTLVELLIAVAVLGILIGVGIPLYKNAVASSQARTCIANRATAVAEADAAATSDTDPAQISKTMRAELDSHIGPDHTNKEICPAGGKLFLSADAKRFFCSLHDHGEPFQIYFFQAMDKLKNDTFKKAPFVIESIDSTATGTNSLRRQAVEKYFTENGIDLGVFGIQSWAMRKEGSKATTYNMFYITDQDISEYEPGDMVRVLRYNNDTGNYTAGYLKVEKSSSGDYNVLAKFSGSVWDEYKGKKQTAATKGDYYATLEIFQEMPVQPEK